MALRVRVNRGEGLGRVPGASGLSPLLARAVRRTLRAAGVTEAEVSLTLLSDPAMTELNRRWLEHDRPTDVMAFALHDPGEPPLGDVYIGVPQALRQAEEHDLPVREELVRLAVHGTLHVLGHDHPEGEERAGSPMWTLQEQLVSEVLS